MVCRIASCNLSALIYTVAKTMGLSSITENGPISTILLDLVKLLASSDQSDSVRLHTTKNCVCFGNAMAALKEKIDDTSMEGANEEYIITHCNAFVKHILPLIVATIDDRSWRVRWTAASKFAVVVKAISSLNGTMDALVPAYEKLLYSAALNLAEVAKTGSKAYPVGWNEDGMDCSEDGQENRISIAERLVQRVMMLT